MVGAVIKPVPKGIVVLTSEYLAPFLPVISPVSSIQTDLPRNVFSSVLVLGLGSGLSAIDIFPKS